MINTRDDFFEMWWGSRNEAVEPEGSHPLVTVTVDCTGGYLHELPQARIADVVAAQGVGWENERDEKRGRETADRVADYLNRRVAEKRQQWQQILEARDEARDGALAPAGGGAGGVDGGDSGAAREGGAGS
jgi:hypothetical protein